MNNDEIVKNEPKEQEASEKKNGNQHKKRRTIIISICVVVAIIVIGLVCTPLITRYREEKQLEARYNQMIADYANGNLEDDYSDLKGYKDRDEIRLEARYNQMVSAYSEGNFEDDYSDLKEYKDRTKYYYYRKAHQTWDFDNDVGVYRSTIDNLQKASGILDADEKQQLISEKMSQYNGTWHSTRYGRVDIYILVKDGKVAMEVSDIDGAKYYFYDLVRMAFDEEDIKKYFGSSDIASLDTTLKTNVIGYADSNGDVTQNYLFMDVDDGQMFAFDISDQSLGTFNGLYTKISEDTPPSK